MPNQSNDSKKIPFKIDKTHDEIDASQNPVTGTFLMALEPPVLTGYELWLRGRDGQDDIVIRPGDQITIKPGDHFFTAKQVSTEGGKSNA